MLVTSVTLVTRREPSVSRETWITRSSADADLLAHGAVRQIRSREQDHRLEAGQRVARRVGVDRGERSFVPGVHGLQHVQRLRRSHLADDDAVRAHAERVLHEISRDYLAASFRVGRSRLQTHHVLLLHPKLGGVFDRDHALAAGNERAERVEQRRFSGARAAGDENVELAPARSRPADSPCRR